MRRGAGWGIEDGEVGIEEGGRQGSEERGEVGD